MARKVIICGDERYGNAIKDGVISAELNRAKSEIKQLQALNGVRSAADKKRWKKTRRRLARKYTVRPLGRISSSVLGVYGLILLSIDEWYRYFKDWNRSG